MKESEPRRPLEVREIHMRLGRVGLALEESHVYWRRGLPGVKAGSLARQAFEQRWFGNKSFARTQILLRTLAQRFDALSAAKVVLHRWCPSDLGDRRLICHWHAQFTDPLYRRFTADVLPERWALSRPTVDRDVVLRWLQTEVPDRWSPTAEARMASGLLTAACDAGLCASGPGKRDLKTIAVSDRALTYWLYVLRAADFEGTLFANPYFRSVGLTELHLENKLRRLSGLRYRRSGDLHDFGWKQSDLSSWASAPPPDGLGIEAEANGIGR